MTESPLKCSVEDCRRQERPEQHVLNDLHNLTQLRHAEPRQTRGELALQVMVLALELAGFCPECAQDQVDDGLEDLDTPETAGPAYEDEEGSEA